MERSHRMVRTPRWTASTRPVHTGLVGLPLRREESCLPIHERRSRTASLGPDTGPLGPTLRTAGSIHTDIREGPAADLANRGSIAVYPITG